MADLVVTFGRIAGPVMRGRDCRSERIAIAAGTDPTIGQMVCDPGDNEGENVADLLAEAACWVEIGPDSFAHDPLNTTTTSFKMASGERLQKAIQKGDKVSVVAVV